MTRINVQAEYLFDPAMLSIPTLPGSSYENTLGIIVVPTISGAVLSVVADLPEDMDLHEALGEALDAFDDALEQVTFDGDWIDLPDLPVDVRILDIGQLVADLRTRREYDQPEPPEALPAAA